jgi:hypothetical protein
VPELVQVREPQLLELEQGLVLLRRAQELAQVPELEPVLELELEQEQELEQGLVLLRRAQELAQVPELELAVQRAPPLQYPDPLPEAHYRQQVHHSLLLHASPHLQDPHHRLYLHHGRMALHHQVPLPLLPYLLPEYQLAVRSHLLQGQLLPLEHQDRGGNHRDHRSLDFPQSHPTDSPPQGLKGFLRQGRLDSPPPHQKGFLQLHQMGFLHQALTDTHLDPPSLDFPQSHPTGSHLLDPTGSHLLDPTGSHPQGLKGFLRQGRLDSPPPHQKGFTPQDHSQ